MNSRRLFRDSIQARLIAALAVLLGGSIFLCWLMNKTLLPSYYQLDKMKKLGKAYSIVSEIYGEKLQESEDNNLQFIEDIDDEIAISLESLGANQNLNVYVFQIYMSQAGFTPKFLYPSMDVLKQEQILDLLNRYMNGSKENGEMLSHTDNYQIFKAYDKRVDSYYLELFGTLDQSTAVYIRCNYQSMLESVAISNRFLAYAGVMATLLGIVIMYFIGRNFTQPILELSHIATRMANLDFAVKYPVKREDEIGILGHSINELSQKLEETISKLQRANEELQKDIDYKTKVDAMRTEFLSNVSHELKTPIALIQGYSEGLLENVNDDPEDRKFYCEVIMDEANKMNQMVKKLLDLNHIEFGENSVSMDYFDIAAVVHSVLTSTEILFQQKGASLTFPEYEPMYVWADEYMIEEVVTNYVSNALNHVSGENQIEVTLVKENNKVRVSVFNTGVPIPQEDLSRIWEKFYKVDKARTREYGGSGIGLSIVKAIMESMQQDFGVVNHENGVEFWFELSCSN